MTKTFRTQSGSHKISNQSPTKISSLSVHAATRAYKADHEPVEPVPDVPCRERHQELDKDAHETCHPGHAPHDGVGDEGDRCDAPGHHHQEDQLPETAVGLASIGSQETASHNVQTTKSAMVPDTPTGPEIAKR